MTWACAILLNSEVEENVNRKRSSLFIQQSQSSNVLLHLRKVVCTQIVSDAKTLTDILG